MDRENPRLSDLQIGFIKGLVMPCTTAFVETNIISRDSIIYKQLTDNLERWEFGNTESAR